MFFYYWDLTIVKKHFDYLVFFLDKKILNLLFTTFCILIVINGSNFMDGLNTLAAGYCLLILFSRLFIIYLYKDLK